MDKGDNGQGADSNTDLEITPSPWQNEWQLRQSLLKLSGTTGNLKKKKTKATQPEVSATQPEVISTQPEVITVTDSDSEDSYTPTLAQTAAPATVVTAGPSGEPAATAPSPAAPANKHTTITFCLPFHYLESFYHKNHN